MGEIKHLMKISGTHQLQVLFNQKVPVYIEVDGDRAQAAKAETQISFDSAADIVIAHIKEMEESGQLNPDTASKWTSEIKAIKF